MEKKDKQSEIYSYLKSYTENKGYPPSIREICEAVSLSSTSTVHGHLKRLEKKGLIKRDPTKPRALEIIELNEAKRKMIKIPIIGKFIAGIPIFSTENIENSFQIPLGYVDNNEDLFILKVSGDSMINVGINDGDLAIIKKTDFAINEDIVLALIENEPTIKRFFKEKNHIRLQPENNTFSPILVPDCSVLGKVVGLYKQY